MSSWVSRFGPTMALVLIAKIGTAQGLVPNWTTEFYVPGWTMSPYAVVADSNGAFVVGEGLRHGEYRAGSAVTRFDSAGKKVWVKMFEPVRARGQGYAYASVAKDGSLWFATSYFDIVLNQFVDIHRISVTGEVLASFRHEFDFESPDPDDLAIRTEADLGATIVFGAYARKTLLRLTAEGVALIDKVVDHNASRFVLEDGEHIYILGGRGQSPFFEFAVRKYNGKGEVIWETVLTPDPDRSDDTAGGEISLIDGNVVASVCSWKENPRGQHKYWMRVFELGSKDGRRIRETNLDESNYYIPPKPRQFGTGGMLLESSLNGLDRLVRYSPRGRILWDVRIEDFALRATSDKFGNVWITGSHRESFLNYLVQVRWPNATIRAQHRLEYLNEHSIATQIDFDPSERAYVVGGHGQGITYKSIICQYPALPCPRPTIGK